MKILTKEEEQAHYNATLKGGAIGGCMGMMIGAAVVYAANARYHAFRQLTLPMKTFLVTSSTTFATIVSADRASRAFEVTRDPQRQYRDKASSDLEQFRASESTLQKLKDWGRENRYPIVTASWVASMGIAFAAVSRNKYLSGAQKLVQARVYAQGLTLAVLIATATFEVGDASKGKGRWETVKVLDPNDPEHKHMIEKKIHHEAYAGEDLWRDMVATEERKIEARKAAARAEEKSRSGAHTPTETENKPQKEPSGENTKSNTAQTTSNPGQEAADDSEGKAKQTGSKSHH